MKTLSMIPAAVLIMSLAGCPGTDGQTVEVEVTTPPAGEQKAAVLQDGLENVKLVVDKPASSDSGPFSISRAFKDGSAEYPFTFTLSGNTATYAEPKPYGQSYTRVVEVDGDNLIMNIGPYEFGQHRYTDVVVRVEGYDSTAQTCDKIIWAGREVLGQPTTYTASCS